MGCEIGREIKGSVKYSYELALSNEIIPDFFDNIEVSLEDAIRFLQKKALSNVPNVKSWALISYQKQPIGWVKKVGNRLNNYFPKEYRIRKDFL